LARKIKKRGTSGEIVVLINPEIFKASSELELDIEGCLSIPHTYGYIRRHRWIKVKALGERGQKREFKAEGFYARILQHEIDHLEGILFTDKVVGRLYTAQELEKTSSPTKKS
jgi:peptide deformylase